MTHHDTTTAPDAATRIDERIDRVIAGLQAEGCTVKRLTATAGFDTATVTISDDEFWHPSAIELAVTLCRVHDLTFTFAVHATSPDGEAISRPACLLFPGAGLGEEEA